MTDQPNQTSEFFDGEAETSNSLWHYVQSLSSETVNQLSQPTSTEVLQVMEHNIVGMLGSLPAEQFNMTVSTSRESLGRLLASAMVSGYFLRNAEQRMSFEQSLPEFIADPSEDD